MAKKSKKGIKYQLKELKRYSKGKQVKNWKQKMQGVWFKEENKTKQTSINEHLKGI